MLSSIYLAAAIAASTPTDWRYEHHVSNFTNEQQITLQGTNSDQSEFILRCTNNQFDVAVFVPDADELDTTFFAKVDNHMGIKLMAESLDNKVTAHRRGVWGNWAKVLNQLKHGKKITFLFTDDGSPTIVKFDTTRSQQNIQTVMERCGNF